MTQVCITRIVPAVRDRGCQHPTKVWITRRRAPQYPEGTLRVMCSDCGADLAIGLCDYHKDPPTDELALAEAIQEVLAYCEDEPAAWLEGRIEDWVDHFAGWTD